MNEDECRLRSPRGRYKWNGRRHLPRGTVLGFALAALLTLALGVRLGVHVLYWTRHHEDALAEWMTLGYVAQSWGVERDDLARALDVAPGTGRRLTLAEIARVNGRSEAEVEDALRATIAAGASGERTLIEAALALIPVYGGPALFVVAGLSCFGLPIPGSIALLASGAFVAGGDMALSTALAAGLGGAVVGDQAGYWLGAGLGRRVTDALAGRRALHAALDSAAAFSERRGAMAVFLSRWLLAPLGPAVNVVSGTIGMAWLRFSVAEVLGELVWVGIYVGLGALFSRSVIGLAEVLGDLTWFLAAGVVAVALLMRLLANVRAAAEAPA